MPMTPERITERVGDLVESIRYALSSAFTCHEPNLSRHALVRHRSG